MNMYVLMNAPMTEHLEAKGQCLVSLSIALHLMFEAGSLSEPEAHQLSRLATCEPLLSSCLLPGLESQEHNTTVGFYVEDPNSVVHTYTSTSPTIPAPQPRGPPH